MSFSPWKQLGAAGGGGSGGGSCSLDVVAVSADYAAGACEWVQMDATGGARTITFPAAPKSGQLIVVEKTDASTNFVTVSGSGLTTRVLYVQNERVFYRYNGAAWVSIGEENSGPALQPNLYSPLVAYPLDALDPDYGNFPGVDRQRFDVSGNNRPLSAVNVNMGADLRGAGHGCWVAQQSSNHIITDVASSGTNGYAALRLTGAMTLTCRAFISPQSISTGSSHYISCEANFSDGSAAGNALWLFGVDGNGRLLYVRDTGTHVGGSYASTLAFPDGEWHFVTLRREASGVVTVGLDETYQTSGAIAPPTGGSNSYHSIGGTPSNGEWWLGGIADLRVFNTRLTDAELVPLYRVAMGVR